MAKLMLRVSDRTFQSMLISILTHLSLGYFIDIPRHETPDEIFERKGCRLHIIFCFRRTVNTKNLSYRKLPNKFLQKTT